MATGIVDTYGVSGVKITAPPPPPPPPPGTTYFAPTSLAFSKATYAPGDTVSATVTGAPASDGSLPAVTLTDSSGRSWTKTAQTASTINATTAIAAADGTGIATLTVRTSPGAGVIADTYSVVAVTPPGTYPIPYMVTVPAGACGAGYCNVAFADGSLILYGGDVYGSHRSKDGGLTCSPVRDGQDTSDKLRIAGYCRDGGTAFAFAVGRAAGETSTTGTGVTKNYILRSTIGADGSLSAWSVHVQLPGAWASGGNGFQAGDTYADTSGHPRQTGKMIDIKPGSSGYFVVGSWDGLWRVNRDGTGVTRIWGAGNSITAVRLDPAAPTTAYVTIDLGPKKGIWKLTGIDTSTPTEAASFTGDKVPYAQSLAVWRQAGQTHLVVATGRQVNSTTAARTWAVAYLPGGASWATGWRDITGVIGDDIAAGSYFLSAGIDAIVTPTGTVAIGVGHAGDKTGNGGGGTRVAWAFNWDGVGAPAWERPTAAITSYNLGNDPGKPWWFQYKQPSFMIDKPGFDCKSPVFVNATTILFPGRSGVWLYDRALNKVFPVVEGLLATYAWGALCHPTDGRKGGFLDTDWNLIRWKDGPWAAPLMSPAAPNAGSPSGMVAWGGSITPTGAVSISSGEGGNGSTHTCDDMWVAAPTYIRQDNTGANQPPGAEHRGSLLWGTGAGMRLVAAVQGSGLWLKDGSGAAGTWSKVVPGVTVAGKQTRLFSAASGDVGLVCDNAAGLWRTTNKGGSWTPLRSGGAGDILSGHVTADPGTPGRFWHVAGNKLYEVTPAGALTDITPSAFTHPTAVAAWRKTAGSPTLLVVSDGPKLWLRNAAGGAWVDITTQSWRHCTGGLLRGLAITADGVVIGICQSSYVCLLINPDA